MTLIPLNFGLGGGGGSDELFNIIGEYIDSCDDTVIAMIPEGE